MAQAGLGRSWVDSHQPSCEGAGAGVRGVLCGPPDAVGGATKGPTRGARSEAGQAVGAERAPWT